MKCAVLILGIARSGTSAVAGALCASGLPFGDALKPADWQNPKGNHEDFPLSRLNQRLLARFGRSWSDTRRMPDGWLGHPETAVFAARIADQLVRRFSQYPAFGLKDPRLVVLYPLYARVLRSEGWTVRTITVARDESEVVASICKSGYLHGLYLPWRGRRLFRHYMTTVNALREETDSIHVTYDELIESPRQTLSKVVDGLGLGAAGLSLDIGRGAAFVDPSLWRNRASGR